MEITPEVQEQLDEAKKNCIFCKILSGEMQGKEVYSDGKVHAVLDINPWLPGHVLLMPKEHYPIMPYIPAATFTHMFGLMPRLVKYLKRAMVATGANILIANGGAAGQQSPHFLVHVLPRESGDRLGLYSFSEKKSVDSVKAEEARKLLANNIPLMMRNHFMRNPADWRKKSFSSGLYEDEKVICSIHETPLCIGHIRVDSKEASSLEELSPESAAHLFFTASFCATAVFEGLGAHGTNIILKTGRSNDNQGFSIHILPRYQDDGLNLLGTPMDGSPELDLIADKIKGEMFYLKNEVSEQERLRAEKSAAAKNKEFEPKSQAEKEIHQAILALRGK